MGTRQVRCLHKWGHCGRERRQTCAAEHEPHDGVLVGGEDGLQGEEEEDGGGTARGRDGEREE
eukprot:1180768-Rhodomonas_salina.2